LISLLRTFLREPLVVTGAARPQAFLSFLTSDQQHQNTEGNSDHPLASSFVDPQLSPKKKDAELPVPRLYDTRPKLLNGCVAYFKSSTSSTTEFLFATESVVKISFHCSANIPVLSLVYTQWLHPCKALNLLTQTSE